MSHNDNLLPIEHHDRTEFQVERLILFSDAVFAIAITLLVIEIKVPELHHPTNEGALRALLYLIPKFVGFLIGFFVIAVYWVAHHRIFRFVHRYNDGLIWANVLFLLSIVIMPFTSAYYSEYTTLDVPFVLYACSVIATGLLQLRLQRYLSNPANGLVPSELTTHPDLDPVRPLVAVAVFAAGIALALLLPNPWPSRMSPVLVFPLMVLYGRRYRRLKQAYQVHHQQAVTT